MYTYVLLFALSESSLVAIDQVDKATCEYNSKIIEESYEKISIIKRPSVELFCIPKDRKNG